MKNKRFLVSYLFDDFSSNKVRPALCLTEPTGPHKHVVLAFITSRIAQQLLPTDLIIDASHEEFGTTGLRVSSTLQLHRLMTVTTSMLRRELGTLPPSMQAQVSERLLHLFDLE